MYLSRKFGRRENRKPEIIVILQLTKGKFKNLKQLKLRTKITLL